jgi:hypothetical protein
MYVDMVERSSNQNRVVMEAEHQLRSLITYSSFWKDSLCISERNSQDRSVN